MSFSINFDRSLGAERRRIALAQIDRAIVDLDASEQTLVTRVHQFRKRCKKLRALARLFRPANEREYRALNLALRDAARRVSALRDADAALATHEHLLEHYSAHPQADHLRALRGILQAHREHEAERGMTGAQLSILRVQLDAVRGDVLQWSKSKISSKTLARGLAGTYKDAYKAMRVARKEGGSLAWHEWRKQVKYLRYQLKIVRRSWRTPLDSWRRDLNRLSDLIGLDHDLVELLQLLSRQGAEIPSPEALKHLEQLCEERSQQLRHDALALGETLFEERPAVMRRALQAVL